MTLTLLPTGDGLLTHDSLIPFLVSHHLIPHLLREQILNRAIDQIQCTAEETSQACQAIKQRWGVTFTTEYNLWCEQHSLTQEAFEAMATRSLRLQKFKQQTWGLKVESLFLENQSKFDRVIYSMLRIQDMGMAQELFFRLQEKEQSFADLAKNYSQGPEAQTGGLLGPVELGELHPVLAELLRVEKLGRETPPMRLDEWYIIVRVEERLPARLDDAIRQRLIDEQFEIWFQEQLRQLSPEEKCWMGISPHLVDTVSASA